MSDYLFLLDNHLDAGQNRAVAGIQRLATAAGMNVWLTGGAMRDMLRGAPIRDLDFTVERDAVTTGRALAAEIGGTVLAEDPLHRWVELLLPDGITASVSNARTEKYAKPGATPEISPATIHADLSRRDFTINAIALSLGRGSRGLLVDPANGQADLLSRELRTCSSFAFLDDPARIYRLFRFQHVLGFTLHPRTQSQLENALLEEYQSAAASWVLGKELRTAVREGQAAAMLAGLDSHGLLKVLSGALTGSKLNPAGLEKLGKLAQSVLPSGFEGGWLAFAHVLTEKLTARDRAEVARNLEFTADELAAAKKLDSQVGKLEESLKVTTRPSQVWEALHLATADEVLLVLYGSQVRVVQDRIRAYYEKYLPLAQEVTDDEVVAAGGKPGTAKFDKVRRSLIISRLNARPRKIEIVEPEPVQVAAAVVGRGRR